MQEFRAKSHNKTVFPKLRKQIWIIRRAASQKEIQRTNCNGKLMKEEKQQNNKLQKQKYKIYMYKMCV